MSDKRPSKQSSKDFPDAFYRVSVKAICVHEGKIMLERESEELGGGWELPGGGLDFGEGLREGLKREIQEELGLKISRISEKPAYIWTTRYDNWRGLEWYYALIIGYRVEFENLEFKPTDEALEMRFFSKEELSSLDCSNNPNTEEFKKVFNPKDFPADFLS